MIKALTARPWRSPAFRIQALALLLAGFAITALLGLRTTVEQRFNENSAVAMGGDLLLEGSHYPEAAQRAALQALPHSEQLSFSSVLIHNDTFLLASIRAIDEYYPLYGQVLKASDRFAEPQAVEHGPAPGTLWLASTALERLGITLGERINLGQKDFTVSHLLVQEPDQGAGFYSMNPRVLMHQDDLAEASLLGAGSRYEHRLLVVADQQQQEQIQEQLEPQLRPDQRLIRASDSELAQQGPILQLFLWTQLAVMLVVLLCAAAIYLSAGQRARQQRVLCAVLKTIGAQRRAIVSRTLGSDLAALLVPTMVGALLAQLLVWQVRQWLGAQGGLALSVSLFGLLAPLLLWLGFAAPTLWQQLQSSPQQLLRDTPETPRGGWPILLAALLTPLPIAWLLAGSLSALWPLLMVMAIIAVGLPLLLWPLVAGLDRFSGVMPLPLRLALRRLSRRKAITLPLLAALVMALGVLSLSAQSGRELLGQWRATLPDQAPNYFVVNLFDQDLPIFEQWLQTHAPEQSQPLYPVTRGRLVEVNGVPVREAVTKEEDRAERALSRDLSLTESDTLAASNSVSAGRWLEAPGEVSVESELADALGLAVGDQLTFTASGGAIRATVVGMRQVNWESFAPNFYFVFSPDTLSGQDRTWLTSFYSPQADSAALNALVQQLPHISLLDVNALLDTIQGVIQQASQAAMVVAALLLLAALLVLSAALLASAEQQRRDNRLLQILGAPLLLLRKVSALRALLLIGGAALLANLLHLLALWPLGQRLLDGALPLSVWLLAPWVLVAILAVWAWQRPGSQLRDRQY